MSVVSVHPRIGARQFAAARAAELVLPSARPVFSAPGVQSFDTGVWHGPLRDPSRIVNERYRTGALWGVNR